MRPITHHAPGERSLMLAACGSAALLLLLLASSIDRLSTDSLRGVSAALVLGAGSLVLLHTLDRRRGDALSRLYTAALLAKFAGMAMRIFMFEVVYDGNGDAGRYVQYGTLFMQRWQAGDLVTTVGMAGSVDAERTTMAAGAVFMVTGPSFLAASVVFSVVCFWGQYLFTRALAIAVPGADIRRYAVLVMLFPSLLYWPSIVGKDALMIGALGAASWGAASILGQRARLSGVLVFLAGTGTLGLIRPHLALISVCALGLASLVGSATKLRSVADLKASGVRLVVLVLLLGTASFGVTQVSSMLGDAEDEQSLTAVLESTSERTAIGGSGFQPTPVTGPLQLVPATITVLTRPFLFEARNLQSVLSALEGTLIALVVLTSHRRLRAWGSAVRSNPYLIYAAAYTLVFIAAFSYIANFGILARQRPQMLPLFFVFLAMPPVPKRPAVRPGTVTSDREDETDRVAAPAGVGAGVREVVQVHQVRCSS